MYSGVFQTNVTRVSDITMAGYMSWYPFILIVKLTIISFILNTQQHFALQ